MNKKHDVDVLKFSFQKIDITEIPHLLPEINKSKYSSLRAQIVEKIASLAPNESFMFAPDKKAPMSKKLIDAIDHGVNVSLAKEGLNWRIKYSSVAKAFVVAPYKRHKIGQRKVSLRTPEPQETTHTGFTQDTQARLERLVSLVEKKFNVTLLQLQAKNTRDNNLQDTKRAMLYIGRNGLGLKLADISKILGLTSGSATPLCQQALTKPSAKEKVNLLAEELNKN